MHVRQDQITASLWTAPAMVLVLGPYQAAPVICITLPRQVTRVIATADEKSGLSLWRQPKAVKSNAIMLRSMPKRSFVSSH
jgi:hypothetical protein